MLYYTTLSDIADIPDKNGCYVDEDGNKFWYKNNKVYRIGGPAIEWVDGSKNWYFNNKLHRIGGSAIEVWYNGKYWYLFGVEYDEEEYNKLISNIPLFYWKNRDELWK